MENAHALQSVFPDMLVNMQELTRRGCRMQNACLQNMFLDMLLNIHRRMCSWTCFSHALQNAFLDMLLNTRELPDAESARTAECMLLDMYPPRYIMPSTPSLFLFHQSSFQHILTILPTTDHALSTIQHHLHFNSNFPPCPFPMHHQ
jgi:hypothetical protein